MKHARRIGWEKASWIAGVASAVLALGGVLYETLKPKSRSPVVPSVSQIARDGSTQIGNVFGTVIVNPSKDEKGNAQSHAADHVIFRGVTEAILAYNKTGMAGMLLAAEDCYAAISSNSEEYEIKRCFAMDLSGLYLDQQMVKLMRWPASKNFSEDLVLGRAKTAFAKNRVDFRSMQNIVFNVWVPHVRDDFEDVFARNVLDAK